MFTLWHLFLADLQLTGVAAASIALGQLVVVSRLVCPGCRCLRSVFGDDLNPASFKSNFISIALGEMSSLTTRLHIATGQVIP
jgi:hypothetical protein